MAKQSIPSAVRKRRYTEREFVTSDARKLFGLEDNEIFMDVRYDRDSNKIVVKSLKDHDEKEGDI